MQRRILVVDDEETLCEVLRFNLEAEGYSVDVAHSAEEVLTLDASAYDLILLDIMMGEISGTQLAGILKSRADTKDVPIVFCTAKDSEDDMVRGLDLGADDYIVKPYSIRNVLARVRSVLRRTEKGASAAVDGGGSHSYEGLVVDTGRKRCIVDGEEIKMPRKEFEILDLLLSSPGRIFTREEILKAVWRDEAVVVDRVVDVNIARIRQKIGKYGRHVVSRSGYGYGFEE